MNQNYQNYQDQSYQKYLTEGQLGDDDEEDEEAPTHYNSCFAANNFLGLLLAVFQSGFHKTVSNYKTLFTYDFWLASSTADVRMTEVRLSRF